MIRKVCSFLAFILLLFFFVRHVFKLTDYIYNLILNFFSRSIILEIIIILFFFFIGIFIVNPSLLLQKVITFYNFMNLFKMEIVSSI